MTFKRTFVSFPIPDLQLTRRQLLSWAETRFSICCFLDNHAYALPAHSFECLLAVGAMDKVEANAGNALTALTDFIARHKDWLFGHFGYGLAKETEPREAANTRSRDHLSPNGSASLSASGTPIQDPIGFPDLFFFVPEIVIELSSDSIRIGSSGKDHETILQEIANSALSGSLSQVPAIPNLQARFSREEYLGAVRRLKEHILRGDCYEINFCQEFFSSPATIDPLQTWFSLSRNSPNPFAAYYKLDHRYLLCSSPERYLRRTGNTLLSQPIKGTWPRQTVGLTGAFAATDQTGSAAFIDTATDQAGREQLFHSNKDRSENVMVVDLVRNDMSKLCSEGSVTVEELYGIYTFPQVHQMISSIKGELLPGIGLVDCIRASFPMGSMTGAPKNRVISLIEQFERTPRGIFSGAVGYLKPDGDFDFNVVIRSILYNRQDSYLSYQVGSGITFYSDPELEYEECLLKAEGMKLALGI